MIKIDSTLSRLTPGEVRTLRGMIIEAIRDQPAYDDPAFDAPMAYELSVINWDMAMDIAGTTHLYDEWWLTRNTDIV